MPNLTEELTFRTATEADLPFLLELRRKTMSEHLHLSGIEPSESERVERVLAQFECAEIILLSGSPIGLLKVARDGKKWDLTQIQIVPEKQGTGLGGGILKKLLDEAREAQATVTLSVLKSNPARRLYERLGFRIVGENDKAYDMEFGGEAWVRSSRMPTVREIKQRQVEFGGAEHSGWLPTAAAHPLPTPQRVVLVDFSIIEEGRSSFLLVWRGPDKETSGDTWHPDLEAALHQAEDWFGIERNEWR